MENGKMTYKEVAAALLCKQSVKLGDCIYRLAKDGDIESWSLNHWATTTAFMYSKQYTCSVVPDPSVEAFAEISVAIRDARGMVSDTTLHILTLMNEKINKNNKGE